jgi:Pyruvate/2-oxoacid:ferredoxin oxidoreductase delta subunit
MTGSPANILPELAENGGDFDAAFAAVGEIDYDYCKGCGICAAECPCGAIAMVTEQA